MNTPNHIEVIFDNINVEQSDRLVAILSDFGFDGFEEAAQQLKAYIQQQDFDMDAFAALMQLHQLSYAVQTIPAQNWNSVWEAQFEPVLVNDFVGVRAHFHPSFANNVQHEIVITPKMSFGTGHHATTWMMMEQMQHIDFTNRQVLDFGTGTGILAILSEKLGAVRVKAIDIDEWSIANAAENVRRNHCTAIDLQQADQVLPNKKFDVVLANINKNVILQNIKQLSNSLVAGGCLLISGLLIDDEQDILSKIKALHLTHKHTLKAQQWICMRFTR